MKKLSFRTLKQICIATLTVFMLIGGSFSLAAAPNEAILNASGQLMLEVDSIAGTGVFSALDGKAAHATFRTPQSMIVLPDQSILVADTVNHLIRQIADGIVTTYAGITFETDAKGFPIGGLSDGAADIAVFNSPSGLAVDQSGNIYVADAGNHAIRKISTTGEVTTIAGNGVFGSGDGKGEVAQFYYPQALAITDNGTLYVADSLNHSIRKISPSGVVSTLNALSSRAVEVFPGVVETAGDFKDGKLNEALFNEPSGLALDQHGNLYVSDSGNQRIRYIDFETNMVTTVAGGGLAEDGKALYERDALHVRGGYSDGKAAEALFNFPHGIAITAEGGLLIADMLNHSIRYLYDGMITTIAGNVDQESGNVNGLDRSAHFHRPTDMVLLSDGSIGVVDSYNNQIRSITLYELPAGLPVSKDIKVVYNHNIISFEDGNYPEIRDDRTMIPVRAMAEAIGYTVTYDSDQSGRVTTVQLSKDDTTVELSIGEYVIATIVDGQLISEREIDVAPYIEAGRTYVPVRFFAEAIDLDVQWLAAERTVIIRDK